MRRLGLGLALCLLAACGDDRTRSVQARLDAPTELDFGAVPVLNEAVLTVPLLNQGRTPLLVEAARLSVDGTPFAVKGAPEEVGIGETLDVELGFIPPAEKPYAGTLVLETSDPENPVWEVQLKGLGSKRALLEVEPAELIFERVAECGAKLLTVEVKSKGTADLILQEIGFAPGTSPSFSFVGSTKTPAVVKPGRSVQLTVRYAVKKGATAPETGAVRLLTTDPEHREVLIPLSGEPNRAPLPSIKPFGNAAPGATVALDASASSDPDGDTPLTYKWTLRSRPLASKTAIDDPLAMLTEMTLDPALPGAYEVQLNVIDAEGAHACAPARATVVARPAQKLLVEMFWNHAKTDIDLHFLRTPGSQVGAPPDDCFYANPTPDWGAVGAADNPSFLRDALTGYGPEIVGYVEPVKTTFTVVAEFTNAHFDPAPATEVTVRIYEFGELEREFKRTLEKQGDVWAVADIEWDSGVITERP